jgi:hypothetical protein
MRESEKAINTLFLAAVAIFIGIALAVHYY